MYVNVYVNKTPAKKYNSDWLVSRRRSRKIQGLMWRLGKVPRVRAWMLGGLKLWGK